MYKEQVEALLEGGVDLFVLETFSDLPLIEQAIRAVRELSDLPIVAQMTIQMDGKTHLWRHAREIHAQASTNSASTSSA